MPKSSVVEVTSISCYILASWFFSCLSIYLNADLHLIKGFLFLHSLHVTLVLCIKEQLLLLFVSIKERLTRWYFNDTFTALIKITFKNNLLHWRVCRGLDTISPWKCHKIITFQWCFLCFIYKMSGCGFLFYILRHVILGWVPCLKTLAL